jgi:uncharacterized membrane protein YeiH
MLARVAAATAVALAVLASLVLLVVPIYAGYSESATSQGGGLLRVPTGGSTLVQVNSPSAVLTLGLPLMLVVAPILLGRSRFRRSVTYLAAVFLTVFVVLGSFSIGLLYAPAAIALWVTSRGRRPQTLYSRRHR